MSALPAHMTNRHFKSRLAALAAIVVIVCVAAWQFEGGRIHNLFHSTTAPTAQSTVVSTLALSSAQLVRTSVGLNQPVYWIGASGNPTTYGFTRNSNGEIFVRYLPVGVTVGSRTPYLAVGTYPMTNAFAVTTALAAKANAVPVTVPQSGVGFYLKGRPQNIYVAYPNASYQVEVFDPTAAIALGLVTSGFITDASATASNGARTVTAAQLALFSTSLSQPIFWLGPKKNTTYEFTQATDGRIYVRYLPKGVAAGSRNAYLTIGTYPMTDAYAVTHKLATGSQKVASPIANSTAFTLKSKPTSVYVAFQGTNYQVEVYDPTAAGARQIVTSGQVQKAN